MSLGPDQILPADSYTTINRYGTVKFRTAKDSSENEKPISIPSKVREVVKKGGNMTALAVKRDGKWLEWTFQQYLQVP